MQFDKIRCVIDQYIQALKQYNQTTNIYAKTAYDHLDFHCQDACVLASIIGNTACHVVDMGSGSGLPAVIIALTNPHNHVTAIESKSRKTQFLVAVKADLNITNLTICNQAVQTWTGKADIVTAKAFKPIKTVIQLAKKISRNRCLIPISQRQYNQLSFDSQMHTQLITQHNTDFYYVDWSLSSNASISFRSDSE